MIHRPAIGIAEAIALGTTFGEFLNILTWVYLLRYALFFSLLLVAFPVLALKTRLSSLFAGLFDVDGRGAGMVIVTLTAMTTAWTMMLTTWLILAYSGRRFDLAGAGHSLSFNCFVIIYSLAALPVLISVFWESTRQGKTPFFALFGRAVLGLILAAALLNLSVPIAKSIRRSGVENWIVALFKMLPDGGAGYIGRRPGAGSVMSLLPFHGMALGLSLVSFALYIAIGQAKYARLGRSARVPTLAYMLLLLMLLCWGLTGAAFFLDRYRIPILALVLLVFLLTSFSSHSDHYYHVLEGAREGTLSPGAALRAGGRSCAIVVAANGGGIQAAAWTARVLTGLELKCREEFGQQCREFGRSIRYVSSVSGGSVGAMYFVNAYSDQGLPDREALENVVARAEESSLDEIAWGLAYPDLWRPIFPFLWSQRTDRGKALEVALERGDPQLSRRLTAWREGVQKGWRPATTFNATIADTGERLLFATTDLEPEMYGRRNFYDLYPHHDVSAATAARLSATFPYVSPAARADLGGPRQPQFHAVDGGYYDNYGTATLVEWLDSALNQPDNSIEHVLVLEIRGAALNKPKGYDTSRGWFYQFFAPLATMLHVRTAAQLSYAEAEVGLIKRIPYLSNTKIDSVVFEFPAEDVPLSWHLTKQQKQNIESAWQQELKQGEGWDKVKAFLLAAGVSKPPLS